MDIERIPNFIFWQCLMGGATLIFLFCDELQMYYAAEKVLNAVTREFLYKLQLVSRIPWNKFAQFFPYLFLATP